MGEKDKKKDKKEKSKQQVLGQVSANSNSRKKLPDITLKVKALFEHNKSHTISISASAKRKKLKELVAEKVNRDKKELKLICKTKKIKKRKSLRS